MHLRHLSFFILIMSALAPAEVARLGISAELINALMGRPQVSLYPLDLDLEGTKVSAKATLTRKMQVKMQPSPGAAVLQVTIRADVRVNGWGERDHRGRIHIVLPLASTTGLTYSQEMQLSTAGLKLVEPAIKGWTRVVAGAPEVTAYRGLFPRLREMTVEGFVRQKFNRSQGEIETQISRMIAGKLKNIFTEQVTQIAALVPELVSRATSVNMAEAAPSPLAWAFHSSGTHVFFDLIDGTSAISLPDFSAPVFLQVHENLGARWLGPGLQAKSWTQSDWEERFPWIGKTSGVFRFLPDQTELVTRLSAKPVQMRFEDDELQLTFGMESASLGSQSYPVSQVTYRFAVRPTPDGVVSFTRENAPEITLAKADPVVALPAEVAQRFDDLFPRQRTLLPSLPGLAKMGSPLAGGAVAVSAQKGWLQIFWPELSVGVKK